MLCSNPLSYKLQSCVVHYFLRLVSIVIGMCLSLVDPSFQRSSHESWWHLLPIQWKYTVWYPGSGRTSDLHCGGNLSFNMLSIRNTLSGATRNMSFSEHKYHLPRKLLQWSCFYGKVGLSCFYYRKYKIAVAVHNIFSPTNLHVKVTTRASADLPHLNKNIYFALI